MFHYSASLLGMQYFLSLRGHRFCSLQPSRLLTVRCKVRLISWLLPCETGHSMHSLQADWPGSQLAGVITRLSNKWRSPTVAHASMHVTHDLLKELGFGGHG